MRLHISGAAHYALEQTHRLARPRHLGARCDVCPLNSGCLKEALEEVEGETERARAEGEQASGGDEAAGGAAGGAEGGAAGGAEGGSGAEGDPEADLDDPELQLEIEQREREVGEMRRRSRRFDSFRFL